MNRLPSSRQVGATIVEFAVVLPLLVMLVFGITELGRALYQFNILEKAVISGSRYMSREPDIIDPVACSIADSALWAAAVNEARDLVIYGTTRPSGEIPIFSILASEPERIDITINNDNDEGICVISVVGTVDFISIFGGGTDYIPFFGNNLELQANSEDRYLGQ